MALPDATITLRLVSRNSDIESGRAKYTAFLPRKNEVDGLSVSYNCTAKEAATILQGVKLVVQLVAHDIRGIGDGRGGSAHLDVIEDGTSGGFPHALITGVPRIDEVAQNAGLVNFLISQLASISSPAPHT